MKQESSHSGSCYCGSVQFTVSGEPSAVGHCHCDTFRQWSAGPVVVLTLWKSDAVKVTQGADNIGSFAAGPGSFRKWCRLCGGQVFTEHPEKGLTDVYTAVVAGFKPKSGVRVHCQETALLDA